MCSRWCGWSDEPVRLALQLVHFGYRSDPRPDTRDQEKWTEEERQYVRDHWATDSLDDIGKAINRTGSAVRAEGKRMFPEFRKPRRFTGREG